MKNLSLVGLAALIMFSFAPAVFCAEEKKPNERIIAIATQAAKEAGVTIEEADIIYDEDGKLWCERIGFLIGEEHSPNHGILRKGFLKNYHVVYFDFKDPIKDVWVFVDKDTGEVFTVYKEE